MIAGTLLDPARLKKLAAGIDPDKAAPVRARGGGPQGQGGTSHLCVVDAEGNAVALTTTVNGFFGSKLMTPGGITLNNEIDDFTIASGVPNLFGLVQSDYNLVGAGKRPLHLRRGVHDLSPPERGP
jgi:gamma-glutamyltranspeptidase/glutathione hydrolase